MRRLPLTASSLAISTSPQHHDKHLLKKHPTSSKKHEPIATFYVTDSMKLYVLETT